MRQLQIATNTERRAKRRKDLTQTRRLSKYKYEPPEAELHLPDELSGSLRLLKVLLPFSEVLVFSVVLNLN